MLSSSDGKNMYSTDGSDMYKVLMGYCLLKLMELWFMFEWAILSVICNVNWVVLFVICNVGLFYL
jgi:hypothetical protein